ncbi:hypothetical protein BX661DRAFT_185521 [Kickxella alabastrina]|uniref:uncharacterized protein n=1 Tax=Kickxella alabastrina TaxID=61397 RepID=UPI00221F5319|nr:uncharacterized protein BX661DRAFT_185521 [Kickxella alabastrina]KAI7824554.1 hypothetical protein BX661DRAFT_185521 [Kickxella alabastrina]
MGCRKCRGWEESECCLSQHTQCACDCHTSCDCAFCYTIQLKARSLPAHLVPHTHTMTPKTATSLLSSVLRLESRSSLSSLDDRNNFRLHMQGQGQVPAADDHKLTKSRKWSRRSSLLKPLRLFA